MNNDFTKIPPQAKDCEEAVLGAILLERDAFEQASELLSAECFYVEAHQKIFTAMQTLWRNSQGIDIPMVKDQLQKSGDLEAVGESYLNGLTRSVVSSAHTTNHSRIIYEKYLKREVIRIGSQMVGEAFIESTDAFELLNQLELSVQKLTSINGVSINGIDQLLVERFKRIVELKKQDQHITGIPSGFKDLDSKTHGFQDTDLIILAARPGMGKTAFALNIARNAAKIQLEGRKPARVGIFSLEMSKGQLVDRIIAAESEVFLDKIMTGKMNEFDLKQIYMEGVQPLASLGIYVDDTAALNVFQLRTRARYMKKKYGVTMIIIDYLQLMSGVENKRINNREQEISNISRNLKIIAKELQVPVIALSQLSRDVEKRGGEKKEPKLSDLRDSGAIEQDADMVLFIYRPEYYESDDIGKDFDGLTEISIAKNRSGKMATGPDAIKLKARLDIQKFETWVEKEDIKTVPTNGSWRPVTLSEKDELF